MRDISRFQSNVARAAKQIRDGYRDSDPEDLKKVFKKFQESGQEPVKIAAALFCFFAPISIGEREEKELERYIRTRIRNVTEALIEADAPEQIACFVDKEWFGLTELNGFLVIARERKKLQSLIYLMTVKNDRYGYQERVWEL